MERGYAHLGINSARFVINMIKILLMMLCFVFGHKTIIVLDVLNNDSQVVYMFYRPEGSCRKEVYHFTDVGGEGKTYLYKYRSGATLYLSNGESLCPLKDGNHYCLTGDAITIGVYPDDYSLSYSGYIQNEGYYCEYQTRAICVGYYGVKSDEKDSFDRAVESINRVYQRSNPNHYLY